MSCRYQIFLLPMLANKVLSFAFFFLSFSSHIDENMKEKDILFANKRKTYLRAIVTAILRLSPSDSTKELKFL